MEQTGQIWEIVKHWNWQNVMIGWMWSKRDEGSILPKHPTCEVFKSPFESML